MSARRLSGVVACLDNEGSIGMVVNKLVQLCDEVIVVDGGSRDRTVERALVHDSVRLYELPQAGSAAELLNFGFDQCSWDWILMVEPDELLGGLTPRFVKGLLRLPGMKWFGLRRYRVVERSGELHYLSDGQHQPDRQIRLFRNLPGFRYDLTDSATPSAIQQRTGVGFFLPGPRLFKFDVLSKGHAGASTRLSEAPPELLHWLRGGKTADGV